LTKVKSKLGEQRSVPADMKAQLAGLAAPSPKAPDTEAIMEDISRIMRGEEPIGAIKMASTNKSITGSGSATGNTVWARLDAEGFDKDLKGVRREGDKNYRGWEDSYKTGSQKIGEGSYGTVIRNSDGTLVKRGDISTMEAALIGKLSKVDLGPTLVAADINGPGINKELFVDVRSGRIAMGEVPGRPMGSKIAADGQIGGKNAADIYWKAMADLHRQGIAHNDAHIDNILVDNTGKGRWVDLGLAQNSPKAALAEAMGVFKPLKGGDDITVPAGARGEGNWQSGRWDGTGVKEMNNKFGGLSWKDYQQRFPVASRVWDNKGKVIQEMERLGLDINEINTIISHGIRSTPESYNKSSGFERLTDGQAKDLLNTLYDGI
jgi:hypothetical protein